MVEKLEVLKKTLDSDFDDLRGYNERRTQLTNLQKQVLDICKSQLVSESDWGKILQQEFYLHWIQHIEHENSVLRTQPFEMYVDNCKRLSALVRQHRDLTKLNIVKKIERGITRPTKIGSRRRDFRNNPELSMWTTLASDLQKKRKILPVRKLIEKYLPIIFKLAPCWLASPEAVASVFPLVKNLFDYIIIDEASQMAVERILDFPLSRAAYCHNGRSKNN